MTEVPTTPEPNVPPTDPEPEPDSDDDSDGEKYDGGDIPA